MAPKVDLAQIKKAAQNSLPLSFKTFTLPHETEVYMEDVLAAFLKEFGQEQLKDRLAYCMREIAVNAKKANTKRVYFLDKQLDINKPDDYEKGMQNFKQETLDHIDDYLKKQKEQGLYIKIVFHATGKTLKISVHNNVEISRKEQMRVYDRIARSRAYASMEEALSSVLDDSEGAGLGIVILVLMLKKMGLTEDAFDIDIEGGETISSITVPFSEVHVENLSLLSKAIVAEIDVLPQFPDNLVFLQKLIADPESDISDIARQISMDPSLTADVLKLVNSAQFMLPKKVDNIAEAVKLVGMRSLGKLLYSYGTQKLLDRGQKWLWDHSYKSAYYAYNLAKRFKKKDILDDAYVGGILHDMGKIIFSDVHPDLLQKITSFCKDRGMGRSLVEDLSAGLNHAQIGAMIAQKWNFPQGLVEAIKYHHLPTESDPEYADVVYTVYLANAMNEVEDNELLFDQIDRTVLEDFGIQTRDEFELLRQGLASEFEKEKQKSS